TDCPALSTTCLGNACTAGCCAIVKAAMGATCSDHGGQFCDGKGMCVACVADSQCTATGTACATVHCTGNACANTNAPAGTSCSDGGGTTCDGKGKCVVASCTDGVLDGMESDVDCGGSDCGKCADGKKCLIGSDCVDGLCDSTTHTCQNPTCVDGVQNGME